MSVLLSATGLTKGYGHRPLFSELSLELRPVEKVGLIGPNGAGKSTLLRLLAGREAADDGTITTRRGVRIGYLPQDDVFPAGKSAREIVIDGQADDHLEEHERETRAAITLTQLGFEDHEQPAEAMSGGWRKRL